MTPAWFDFAAALVERVEDKYGRWIAWTLAIMLTVAPLIAAAAALWWAFS
ncbi:hypothetical protein OK349_10870 [Sphingomonas sp. BT-65]|nr:hypothetical protein [Sphingomonas sp. BT-65]MCW4462209.1 hypothetical protein [Sphingomonas sp. BT-65]